MTALLGIVGAFGNHGPGSLGADRISHRENLKARAEVLLKANREGKAK